MMGSEILQIHEQAQTARQTTRTVLAGGQSQLVPAQAHKAVELLASMNLGHLEYTQQQETFTLLSALGDLYLKQGKLHLAAATYHPLLDLVADTPFNAAICYFYYHLCLLYYAWNYLDKAEQHLRWCIAQIQQHKLDRILLLVGYLELAWVLWADGQREKAKKTVQQAVDIARLTNNPVLLKQAQAQQACLWLKCGNLRAATRWAQSSQLTMTELMTNEQQFAYLTFARTLLSERRGHEALALLEQLFTLATAAERGYDMLEISVLKALAYDVQGNLQLALVELAQVLCRAEREGYIRLFVDEGAPMAALLQHMLNWGVTIAYVKQLLLHLTPVAENEETPLTSKLKLAQPKLALIDPLTKRELEVLRLVASGNSNDDIAQMLSITPTTVKKHLGNILGKLAAKNRTQAVAKARALALL
ncbi:MAG: LuxR C-terminal-related transcriptional regulator [Caldilineaceae bacterium]